ncbi:hypothetical protein TSUD_303620 [Trifolium subterraneum]|uniref:Uncharacterized protein n=1 Tax=Trifolium subterraneum TaxID=3900 RepID=A0A2Z6LMZ8_TRISU|nr:hypothetical protein TSUD_303620 [Trifolium subterraneum]
MLGDNIPLDGAITNASEIEEAAMMERSHTLLQNMGVTLEDLKDVKNTHDGWLHYINECLPHFQHRLGFNTACCPIRNNSSRSRGNWGIPRSTPDIWSTEIDHLYLGNSITGGNDGSGSKGG